MFFYENMLSYGRQSIDEDDIEAVAEVLRGDFLTTGPKIPEFENSICAAAGARQAVACANGTAALHLAALALEIGEGDAVIVPSMTFLATANGMRHAGAEVIFADVDPETGMMGVDHVERALSRAPASVRPRAIVAVSLGGHMPDLEGLSALAKDKGMALIFDACHALGGGYKGKPAGACAFEDVAVFSFHPVKAIATGEGGAVTSSDPAAAEKMRILRTHGLRRDASVSPWFYEMRDLGYNYRLSDIQCALGLSQMKKLPGFIARRRELAAIYDELLNPLAPGIQIPARSDGSAWHLYSVRMDFESAGFTRAEFMRRLKERGIGSQVHYNPLHVQPYYRARYGDIDLPGAEKYNARTLSLPLYPAMRDEDVKRVVAALKEAAGA